MKKPIKAALLSALVIPGAGHIYIKTYITATILIGVTLAALFVLVSIAVEKALVISEKILAGEAPLDVAVILNLVSTQPMGDDAHFAEYATIGLIIAWLFGIVDSYRIGRSQEYNT